MGDARPEGLKRVFWNVVLIAAVTILSVAAYNGLVRNWATLKGNLAATTPAAVEEAPEEAPEEAESGASASRLFPPAHSGEPPVMIKQEVARNLMGTRFEITMYAPAGESNPTALAALAGGAGPDRGAGTVTTG